MITCSIIHWRIYILFFYIDKELSIRDRIREIETYLDNQTFYDLMIRPTWITFAALLSYSVLNGLGLVIKLAYDQWISPYIQKVLYNKNIIEKSRYEKLKREYDSQKKDYDLDKETKKNYIIPLIIFTIYEVKNATRNR